MIELTKRYRFSASHRLHRDEWSDELNQATFGKCANPYGHGHNYALEVTVAGPIDPKLGRAADLASLDRVVHSAVISQIDHRNLNTQVPEFQDRVPTTENLMEVIRMRLKSAWPRELPALRRIRIFETRKNIFEIYEGEQEDR